MDEEKVMQKQMSIQPGINNNRIGNYCGYIRRKEAAKYLGISLRTLSNFQRRGIIPYVRIGHRLTLFRIPDLDRAMKRFTIRAMGEETEYR